MSQVTEEYAEIEINFRRTVQPGQGVRITQSYHQPGKITQVMFHFPPGCNALVDMALFKDESPFYPLQGYLALDEATPVRQNIDIEYYANEPLTLEILNRDAQYGHTVSCTVTIKFKKPWWWQK